MMKRLTTRRGMSHWMGRAGRRILSAMVFFFFFFFFFAAFDVDIGCIDGVVQI